jgi:hypothetical protein
MSSVMSSRFEQGNWRNKRGHAVNNENKDLNIRHFDLMIHKDIYNRLVELYPFMYNTITNDKTQGRWVDETQIK